MSVNQLQPFRGISPRKLRKHLLEHVVTPALAEFRALEMQPGLTKSERKLAAEKRRHLQLAFSTTGK